ncbi:hypothetical protein HDU78_002419 [Chytriomyces hyalinus]|nr:hypothetical protein HDU78_002419 [Chytriomyces hyalinus]
MNSIPTQHKRPPTASEIVASYSRKPKDARAVPRAVASAENHPPIQDRTRLNHRLPKPEPTPSTDRSDTPASSSVAPSDFSDADASSTATARYPRWSEHEDALHSRRPAPANGSDFGGDAGASENTSVHHKETRNSSQRTLGTTRNGSAAVAATPAVYKATVIASAERATLAAPNTDAELLVKGAETTSKKKHVSVDHEVHKYSHRGSMHKEPIEFKPGASPNTVIMEDQDPSLYSIRSRSTSAASSVVSKASSARSKRREKKRSAFKDDALSPILDEDAHKKSPKLTTPAKSSPAAIHPGVPSKSVKLRGIETASNSTNSSHAHKTDFDKLSDARQKRRSKEASRSITPTSEPRKTFATVEKAPTSKRSVDPIQTPSNELGSKDEHAQEEDPTSRVNSSLKPADFKPSRDEKTEAPSESGQQADDNSTSSVHDTRKHSESGSLSEQIEETVKSNSSIEDNEGRTGSFKELPESKKNRTIIQKSADSMLDSSGDESTILKDRDFYPEKRKAKARDYSGTPTNKSSNGNSKMSPTEVNEKGKTKSSFHPHRNQPQAFVIPEPRILISPVSIALEDDSESYAEEDFEVMPVEDSADTNFGSAEFFEEFIESDTLSGRHDYAQSDETFDVVDAKRASFESADAFNYTDESTDAFNYAIGSTDSWPVHQVDDAAKDYERDFELSEYEIQTVDPPSNDTVKVIVHEADNQKTPWRPNSRISGIGFQYQPAQPRTPCTVHYPIVVTQSQPGVKPPFSAPVGKKLHNSSSVRNYSKNIQSNLEKKFSVGHFSPFEAVAAKINYPKKQCSVSNKHERRSLSMHGTRTFSNLPIDKLKNTSKVGKREKKPESLVERTKRKLREEAKFRRRSRGNWSKKGSTFVSQRKQPAWAEKVKAPARKPQIATPQDVAKKLDTQAEGASDTINELQSRIGQIESLRDAYGTLQTPAQMEALIKLSRYWLSIGDFKEALRTASLAKAATKKMILNDNKLLFDRISQSSMDGLPKQLNLMQLVKNRDYQALGAPIKAIEVATHLEATIDHLINNIINSRVRQLGAEGLKNCGVSDGVDYIKLTPKFHHGPDSSKEVHPVRSNTPKPTQPRSRNPSLRPPFDERRAEFLKNRERAMEFANAVQHKSFSGVKTPNKDLTTEAVKPNERKREESASLAKPANSSGSLLDKKVDRKREGSVRVRDANSSAFPNSSFERSRGNSARPKHATISNVPPSMTSDRKYKDPVAPMDTSLLNDSADRKNNEDSHKTIAVSSIPAVDEPKKSQVQDSTHAKISTTTSTSKRKQAKSENATIETETQIKEVTQTPEPKNQNLDDNLRESLVHTNRIQRMSESKQSTDRTTGSIVSRESKLKIEENQDFPVHSLPEPHAIQTDDAGKISVESSNYLQKYKETVPNETLEDHRDLSSPVISPGTTRANSESEEFSRLADELFGKMGTKRKSETDAKAIQKKAKPQKDDENAGPNEDAGEERAGEDVPSKEVDESAAQPTEEQKKKRKRKGKGMAKKLQKQEERTKAEAKLREERVAKGLPEAPPSSKQLAAQYLREWSADRLSWKFQKARQLWVLRHLLDTDNIAPNDFTIAVKYCKELPAGTARTMTLERAQQVVAEGLYKASQPELPEEEGANESAKKKEEETKTEEKESADVKDNQDGAEKEATDTKGKKKKSKAAKEPKEKLTEEVLKRARKIVKALS